MAEKTSVLDNFPEYEVVIGIEVHVQLNTKSKIFCRCSNAIPDHQNTTICPICAGHPGTLPVLNRDVVNAGIMAGIATNCTIAKISEFDRKHYFYPDLPKGYQISQNERPICSNGFLEIRLSDDSIKKVRINRIHMEEDAGKSIHAGGNESFIDLNRAGTPLLEIVTEPDISSTFEVRAYLKLLHSIVRYLDIGSANMEQGAFRADTNISVRKKGETKLGTKVELKNINSFKFICDATEYEIERQIGLLKDGQSVVQQTRLWDTKNHETVPMRSKEQAADYRYFPEPDLPLLEINDEWIEQVRKTLPELPHDKLKRFVETIGLSVYEATILSEDQELAQYFEQGLEHTKQVKQFTNWVLRDLMGYAKEAKISYSDSKVTPQKLASIVDMLESGKINNHAAKEVFEVVAQTGNDPQAVVKEKGLEQIGSADELEAIVTDIIANNPNQVAQFKSGKEKMIGFFVGQAMQKTKGKGNPKILQELFKKHLG